MFSNGLNVSFFFCFIPVEPGVIVTDSNERAKKLIRICRSFLHTIIITSENIHPETLTYGKKMNIKLYPFTEIEVLIDFCFVNQF